MTACIFTPLLSLKAFFAVLMNVTYHLFLIYILLVSASNGMIDMDIIVAGWTWWTLMCFLGLLIKDITMPDFTGFPTGLNHESQADGQIPPSQLSLVSTFVVQCLPVKSGY